MFSRLFASAALALLCAAAHAAPSDELAASLRSALAGSRVPAAGVVLLRDGAVSAQAVQGMQRSDGSAGVGIDDVWLIGSTGKVMTVAMIARLVERGVLSWDAPLERMLPELARTMRAEYRTVTLVQLLSHRGGLPRDLRSNKAMLRFFTDARPAQQQRASFAALALRDKPAAAPGTFEYSNAGFLIAAVIAEKVTGATYEDLMRKEVFAPLAMRQVGFGNTADGQNRGHQNNKPMLTMTRLDDGAPAMFAPAGFLHMTLADWARFNLDQLAGAKGQGKLLSAASYRLMQTAQAGSPAGLDWGVQKSIAGRQGPVLVHQGSDGNWLAIAVLFPEQGSGMLAVANAGPDMGADAVLMALAGGLFPSLAPAAKTP